MGHYGNKVWNLILIFLLVTAFAVAMFFNAASAFPEGIPDLFKNTIRNVSDGYQTHFDPAPWTFSVWAVIYVWQLLWILYLISCLCRKGALGYYLYASPNLFSPSLMVVYIINLGCNIGWLLVWDRRMAVGTAILLVLTSVTLYICLVICYTKLYDDAPLVLENDLMAHVWWVRLLLHNGLGIYCGWTTVAMHLNIAFALIYSSGVEVAVASTVMLIVLGILTLLYFSFDLTLLDKWTRYTLTPYAVIIYALCGIILNPKNKPPLITDVNYYLIVGILAMMCVLFFTKLILVLLRHIYHPRLYVRPGVPLAATANVVRIKFI